MATALTVASLLLLELKSALEKLAARIPSEEIEISQRMIKTLEDSVNCGDVPGRQIGAACG